MPAIIEVLPIDSDYSILLVFTTLCSVLFEFDVYSYCLEASAGMR